MTDYDELVRLAREATPGPWEAEHIEDAVDDWWAVKAPDDAFDNVAFMGREDAAYIAAASPDVILALLEERRVLREVGGQIVALLLTSGKEPPPLNDYGLMATLGFYADQDQARRVTELSKAVSNLRAALQERTEATR